MMRSIFFAVGLLFWVTSASAQGPQCRTAEVGSSTRNCASEAFVTESMAAGVTSFDGRTGAVVPVQGDYPTSLIPGTTTNDNATAGNIGEFVSSTIPVGSAVSLSTATPKNVTSISLSPGDWDVTGQVYFLFASTTSGTVFQSSISLATGTLTTSAGQWNNYGTNTALVPAAFNETFGPVGPVRISVASGPAVTVFLVAQANFTVSTMGAWGIIRARRIR